MSAHTPGPWYYIHSGEWSHRIVTKHEDLPDGSPNYWTIADVNKLREPEHEANARLIASAPDLLAERNRLKALNAELATWLSWALNMLPSEEQKNTWQYSQARLVLAKHNEVKS